MKQVLRKGFSQVVVEEIPAPGLRKGAVLVAPAYSLISSGTESSDLHTEGIVREVLERPSQLKALGTVAASYGLVPTIREALAKFHDLVVIGYSGAGVILEKDPTLDEFKVGDQVAYGGQGSGHGEIVCIPKNLLVSLPRGQSPKDGAFATLGAIAMNGTRAAEIQLGDSVAVIGLGLVGQLVAQLAHVAGARTIGLDLMQSRVDLAKKMGLQRAVVAGAGNEAESVRALTEGRGVDCAIICAKSKSSAPLEQAVQMLRDRGRLVIVGAVPLAFPWGPMYAKEIRVTMARAYGPGSYDQAYELRGIDYPIAYVRWTENRNMREFVQLMAEGRVSVQPLVTHEFPLDKAADAYRQIIEKPNQTLAVVLRYETAENHIGPDITMRTVNLTQRNPTGQLGVALIGASNIARWAHIPSVRANNATYLRAVCASRGAAAKGYADRFSASIATTDMNQVLNDPEVKIVLITTRHSQHAAMVTQSLLAGKHVFVEKPMAVTEADCREIVAAEAKSGHVVCVGFNRRYARVYRKTKQLLKERREPVLMTVTMNASWVSANSWIHAEEEGGGAIVGEAVHFFDLFCWLTEEEPISVSASALGGELPAAIRNNNMVVTVQLSAGSVGCLIYTTQGHNGGVQERLEIRAGGRTIIAEDLKRLSVQGKALTGIHRMTPDRGYHELFDDFVAALIANRPSPVPACDGARATMVALKALQSIEKRKTIEF
jgi:predicted dehydrogenase/threonine dehydrogenase-like Zn-dependent dehydrogenase